MNLDDKLRKLITDDTMAYEVDEKIAQIKRAFADAGYIEAHSLPKGIYNATGHSLNQIAAEDTMTGQEFVTRFGEELSKLQGCTGYDLLLLTTIVIPAARRAANISEDSK